MIASALLAAALFASAGTGAAPISKALPQTEAPSRPVAASVRPSILLEIGVDQQLDRTIPVGTAFTDESGKRVQLSDFLGKKPVILAPVYFNCRTVCNLLLTGLTGSLKAVSLDAGEDFEVVAMSFDPGDTVETAAVKRQIAIRHYARGDGGFHFLTGDQASISAVTQAIGYRYRYDEAKEQYAHPAAIVVLTADGRVSRYLYGSEFAPRDLKLALMDASEGRVGTAVERALLYCFEYDPTSGTYGVAVMRAVRIGGAATAFALGAFIVAMLRRDRAQRSARRKGRGEGLSP